MSGPLPALEIDLLAAAELRLDRWRHEAVPLPHWRLYWNPKRGATVGRGSESWDLGPDRILLISPETVYDARGPERPHDHVFLHFTLGGVDWTPSAGIHELAVDAPRRRLIAQLRHHYAQRPQDPDGLRLAAATLCMHALLALPLAVRRPVSVRAPIQRCIDHLRTHYDRQVDNQDLAALAGMHVNSLTRSFRASTGLSPQAWHHRHRIERAGLELVRTDADIESIAIAFGYCDRHHFSRVFKGLRGSGPAAWRRAARSAQGH